MRGKTAKRLRKLAKNRVKQNQQSIYAQMVQLFGMEL